MQIETEKRPIYTFSPGPCSLPLKILLTEGGAHMYNSSIPLNLMSKDAHSNYLVTGFWGNRSYNEAKKYGKINLVHDILPQMNHIPDQKDWKLEKNASYLHFTDNETLTGIQFRQPPKLDGQILVSDMTSSLGRVSGCAIAIIRNDLIGKCQDITPSYMDFGKLSKNPFEFGQCVYPIYVVYEYMKYLNSAPNGIQYWEDLAQKKSDLIWQTIDSSNGFYIPYCINTDQRSTVNITFKCDGGDHLDNKFVQEAFEEGLIELKGHPATKGIRASIYNGTQVEGVKKLRDFMQDFIEKNKN
ncbi:phosphoserine aminotransferase 1, putative [Ichthyophthirius multifiliis]|uniref:phosphoserine transaminase n=1 Tax=Ichthyophthirius multifiliis TaxID=5932 RepID=G0QPZ0_ICHMU|nr:phosphoserine aminotransferase 1, putative [Ichthyophthirius multifiliis]EGR32717.1 phosphoserine aminotransferase 1, putative [Ichthyophthirius multifiliis]|eukprot:XP_004036703.1 phosphoserine aminotransferase 1, putative [Ichthyophthirius multifiliis]